MEVIQLEGPLNGAAFPVGNTTVSYLIEYDNCANADTCSFLVQVEECDETSNFEIYCESNAIDTSCFWIDRVQLGGTSNQSGSDGGYGDYTEFATFLSKGYNHSLFLDPGYAPGHTFNVYWRVWIDYNQNNVFEEGEMIFTAREYQPLEVKFTIPTSAKDGLTRLRIAMNFADDEDPCATLAFGEVEDYLISIGEIEENVRGGIAASGRSKPTTASYQVLPSHFPSPVSGFTPMDLVAARKLDLSVFPNPVRSNLTLQIAKSRSFLPTNLPQQGQLTIFNQLGQKVYQKQLLTTDLMNTNVDVSNFKNGIYFLYLTLGETTTMKEKFVKGVGNK